MSFLVHIPGLSWRDVDDMPFWLWEQCKDEVDRMREG